MDRTVELTNETLDKLSKAHSYFDSWLGMGFFGTNLYVLDAMGKQSVGFCCFERSF